LAQVIDIHDWLDADQSKPLNSRSHRDRAIGSSLAAHSSGPARPKAEVLQWWGQIVQQQPGRDEDTAGHQLCRARNLISLSLVAIGIFMGGTICSVALAYQGDYPVNLLPLFGILIAIPMLLLMATVGASMAQLQGLTRISQALSILNINRWVINWWGRLGGRTLAPRYRGAATTSLLHWQIVVFSQWMSIGFFIGALVTTLVLISFTDIAFGWSTTLQIEALSVHAWVEFAAIPWASWLPVANPDLTLVEQSRFFRLNDEYDATNALILGNWWPFVVMTIVVWGLIPRLLMLGVASWQLQRSEVSLLLDNSQVTLLLDRLHRPEVQFQSDSQSNSQSAINTDRLVGHPLDKDATFIVWNGPMPEHHGLPTALEVSIVQSESERRDAMRQLVNSSQLRSEGRRVVVFTKSWEPPLLEFSDFVTMLRELMGPNGLIRIVPVGLNKLQPTEEDGAIWVRAVAQMHDAGIYIDAAEEEVDE
jgi:hypothetical protein